MSRVIFNLLLLLFVAVTASGQTAGQPQSQPKCTLTLAESPAIRGLKLGMNTEQLLSLFPGSRQSTEVKSAIDRAEASPNYGIARLYFDRSGTSGAFGDSFNGVDSVSVQLFDGQLAQFDVTYAGPQSRPRGPSWPNVAAFVARLSEAFTLPDTRAWIDNSADQKTLKCSGFEIRAYNQTRGSISLFNTQYVNTVRQRAEADEERRRREFKP